MNIRDYKKTLPRKLPATRSWYQYLKFIFILFIIYGVFFTAGKFFKLNSTGKDLYSRKNIQINGNKYITDQTILTICGFEDRQDKEVEIDVSKVSRKIMQLDCIKGVSITFRPPHILNITVEERQPVAFIYGRGLNLIDANGYLIPIPDMNIGWDLPMISGIRQELGKLGEPAAAKEVYLALEIVRCLDLEHPLLAGLISEINMAADDYVQIYLVHGGAKIRTNKNSFDKELYILKTYLANYYDWHMLKKTEYIDLRFADQIVVKMRA